MTVAIKHLLGAPHATRRCPDPYELPPAELAPSTAIMVTVAELAPDGPPTPQKASNVGFRLLGFRQATRAPGSFLSSIAYLRDMASVRVRSIEIDEVYNPPVGSLFWCQTQWL